jgi:hypothetical protein
VKAVSKLIEELGKFPPDALAYAYEGEVIAVVVVDANGRELGWIPATERRSDDGPAHESPPISPSS